MLHTLSFVKGVFFFPGETLWLYAIYFGFRTRLIQQHAIYACRNDKRKKSMLPRGTQKFVLSLSFHLVQLARWTSISSRFMKWLQHPPHAKLAGCDSETPSAVAFSTFNQKRMPDNARWTPSGQGVTEQDVEFSEKLGSKHRPLRVVTWPNVFTKLFKLFICSRCSNRSWLGWPYCPIIKHPRWSFFILCTQ